MSAREFDECEIRRNRWRPTIKCTPFRINSAGPHQRRSFKWERLTVPLIFSRSYSTTNLQLFHQGSQFGPISVNTSPMKAMSGVLESYHRAQSIRRIIWLTGARFTNRSCLGCALADIWGPLTITTSRYGFPSLRSARFIQHSHTFKPSLPRHTRLIFPLSNWSVKPSY